MVTKTDYCGLVSGRETDKSDIFNVFYGTLGTAPMIVECPLSIECRLLEVHDLPTNDLFIGEVVASYTEEKYLTDGDPDINKIKPLLLPCQIIIIGKWENMPEMHGRMDGTSRSIDSNDFYSGKLK